MASRKTGPADAKWTALRRWLKREMKDAQWCFDECTRHGFPEERSWRVKRDCFRDAINAMRRLDRQAPRSPRKAK